MDKVKEAAALVDLPWATLLTLACGYVAYFIAHVGIREHHKTVDVVFSTFVFGFLATFVYQIALRLNAGILTSSAVAFLFALLAGSIWNRFGRALFYRVLKSTRTTTNDDLPSAWAELFAERRTAVTQLSVKLTDGTWLKCSRATRFDKSPHGAVTFGGAGDLMFYVTHEQAPGEEDFTEVSPLHEQWGDEITYIPKERIARIDVRKKWR